MKIQYVGPGTTTEEHDRYKRLRVKKRVRRREKYPSLYGDDSDLEDLEYRRLLNRQRRGSLGDELMSPRRNVSRGGGDDDKKHTLRNEAAAAAAGAAGAGLIAEALHDHDDDDEHGRQGRLGRRVRLGDRHSVGRGGSRRGSGYLSDSDSGSRLRRRSSARSSSSAGGGGGGGGRFSKGIFGRLLGKKDAELRSHKSVASVSDISDLDELDREEDKRVLDDATKAFGFYEVPENYRFVVEKDGRFMKVLGPGSRHISFGEKVVDVHCLSLETLMLEELFHTWDKLEVFVAASLFVRVQDPVAATYAVKNPRRSIILIAKSVLRWCISRVPIDEIFDAVEDISFDATTRINQSAHLWGWWCDRVMLNVDVLPEIRAQILRRAQIHREGQFEMQQQRMMHQMRLSEQDAGIAEVHRQQRAMEAERLFALQSDLQGRRILRRNNQEEIDFHRENQNPDIRDDLRSQSAGYGPYNPVMGSELPQRAQYSHPVPAEFSQAAPFVEPNIPAPYDVGGPVLPGVPHPRVRVPGVRHRRDMYPGMVPVPAMHPPGMDPRMVPHGFAGNWPREPSVAGSVRLGHPTVPVDYEAMDPDVLADRGIDVLDAGSVARGSVHSSARGSVIGSAAGSMRGPMGQPIPPEVAHSMRSGRSPRFVPQPGPHIPGPVPVGDQGESLPMAGVPFM